MEEIERLLNEMVNEEDREERQVLACDIWDLIIEVEKEWRDRLFEVEECLG
jgi:hypothetical protein